MFVTLVVVSAYTDIPQLEPIREQIESFKSEIDGLGCGETGVVGGVAITPLKIKVIESYSYEYEFTSPLGVECIRIEDTNRDDMIRCLKAKIITPPTGAAFLFIYLKVENVGKTKESFPRWLSPFHDLGCPDVRRNEISLNYAGESMDFHLIEYWNGKWRMKEKGKDNPFSPPYTWCSFNTVYPGEVKEGWIAFEVPAGIELEDTTLNIRGLVWRMNPQSQKGIVVMDSEGNIIYEK